MTGTSTGYTQTGADAKFRTAAQVTTAVNAAIASLVGAAPSTLDTLYEIAAQLQSDESGASALTTLVGAIRNETDSTHKAALYSVISAMFPGGTYDSTAHTITFSGGGTGSASLGATAVKTSAYTATANDLVPVDCSAGNVTITLPTAPADKTTIAVKLVATTGSFAATVSRGGATDVFNKASGNTSVTLSLVNQMMLFRYASASGIWYVEDSISLASIQPVISGSTLDKFSVQLAAGAAAIANNVVAGGILVDAATTITKVYLHADTAPVGSALTITATDSSGKLYFTQTVVAGATDQATAAVTAVAIPAGTRLLLNITSVGSTTAAAGVVVDFVCDSAVSGALATSPLVTYIATDTYTAANGTVPTSIIMGSSPVPSGASIQVSSNQAHLITGSQPPASAYNGSIVSVFASGGTALSLADFDVTQLVTLAGDVYPAMLIRAQGGANWDGSHAAYRLFLNNGTLRLVKTSGYTDTLLTGGDSGLSVPGSTQCILRTRVQGDHFQVWYAVGTTLPGSPTIDLHDSTIAGAGVIGWNVGAGGSGQQHFTIDNVTVTSPQ